MNLLRPQLKLSRRPAIRAVLRDEKAGRTRCRWVRPLPVQQEEEETSVKKLFQYHSETSADEAQVVCSVSLTSE